MNDDIAQASTSRGVPKISVRGGVVAVAEGHTRAWRASSLGGLGACSPRKFWTFQCLKWQIWPLLQKKPLGTKILTDLAQWFFRAIKCQCTKFMCREKEHLQSNLSLQPRDKRDHLKTQDMQFQSHVVHSALNQTWQLRPPENQDHFFPVPSVVRIHRFDCMQRAVRLMIAFAWNFKLRKTSGSLCVFSSTSWALLAGKNYTSCVEMKNWKETHRGFLLTITTRFSPSVIMLPVDKALSTSLL